MKANPEVSIIIPCYNQGIYLKESVNSALSQTISKEIIVVDDGSTDDYTCHIIKKIEEEISEVKVIRKKNGGLAKARNFGITHASAPFILPLDADDKISSDYLLKTLPVIKNNEEVGIVYTKTRFFGSAHGVFDVPAYQNIKDMLFQNLINNTALYRKVDWEKVGGYSVGILGMEDYDLWLSLLELRCKAIRIEEALYFYRKYRGSMVSKMDDKVIKENLKKIFSRHKSLYLEYAPEFIYDLYIKQKRYQKWEKIIRTINYIFDKIYNFRKKYLWVT